MNIIPPIRFFQVTSPLYEEKGMFSACPAWKILKMKEL
jgi:hypothetical protein